jgi:hypothetical protein
MLWFFKGTENRYLWIRMVTPTIEKKCLLVLLKTITLKVWCWISSSYTTWYQWILLIPSFQACSAWLFFVKKNIPPFSSVVARSISSDLETGRVLNTEQYNPGMWSLPSITLQHFNQHLYLLSQALSLIITLEVNLHQDNMQPVLEYLVVNIWR